MLEPIKRNRCEPRKSKMSQFRMFQTYLPITFFIKKKKQFQMFSDLPNEIISKVFEWQSVEDFVRLLSTNSVIFHHGYVRRQWEMLFAQRCNLNVADMKRVSLCDLRLLYPLALPFADSLMSDDATGVLCDGLSVVFLATVGLGNRSISAMQPFTPSTKRNKSAPMNKVVELMRMAYDFIRRPTIKASRPCAFVKDRQFSTPFSVKGNPNIFVGPRSTAYYEVEIKRYNGSEVDHTGENDTVESANIECVAVGLATKHFQRQKRFPGWDAESYGYHGDDGAIYHGRGRQLASFGPSFGSNDVVGCGINFDTKSIFFTLNGSYLGVAFSHVSVETDLYPTVGIDAAVSLSFNFGQHPFEFDLARFLWS